MLNVIFHVEHVMDQLKRTVKSVPMVMDGVQDYVFHVHKINSQIHFHNVKTVMAHVRIVMDLGQMIVIVVLLVLDLALELLQTPALNVETLNTQIYFLNVKTALAHANHVKQEL